MSKFIQYFDGGGEFDPNAGRDELYNSRWQNYLKVIENSGKKLKLNEAREYFDKFFAEDWAKSEQERRLKFNADQASKKYEASKKAFWDAANAMDTNDSLSHPSDSELDELDASMQQGAQAAIAARKKQKASQAYWANIAKQNGFNSIEEVIEFQRQNGLVPDGKIGAKTLGKLKEVRGEVPYANTPSYYDGQAKQVVDGVVATRDQMYGPIDNTAGAGAAGKTVWKRGTALTGDDLENWKAAMRRLRYKEITLKDGSTAFQEPNGTIYFNNGRMLDRSEPIFGSNPNKGKTVDYDIMGRVKQGKSFRASNKGKSQNNWFANGTLGAAMAESPAAMTASGWRQNSSGDWVQDQIDDPGVARLRKNLAILGAGVTAGTVAGLVAAPTAAVATTTGSRALVPVINGATNAGRAVQAVAPQVAPQVASQTGGALVPVASSSGAVVPATSTGSTALSTVVRPVVNYSGKAATKAIESGVKKLPQMKKKFFGPQVGEYVDFTMLKQGGNINKFQQGGSANNEQELQKAFMAFLIEDAAAQGVQIQSEQDLQAYAEQLGEEGLKAKYQEFMQRMQGGVKAQLGAKLSYIRKIKGLCPEGQELVYMKEGGRMCTKCMQKAQNGTKTTKKPVNAVQGSKKKQTPMPTKYDGKKHERLALLNADPKKKLTQAQTDSLNAYSRLYRELPDSVKARDYNDQEVQSKACGGKAKKH